MVEKLELPFPLLSDAKGELSKLYGLWNGEEGVAKPAIIALDSSGKVQYLYSGSDFADRPGNEKIFEAVESVGGKEESQERESEVVLSADEAQQESVRPERPAITLEQLIPYYRGVFFTTVALKKRFGKRRDREAFNEVDDYQKLTSGYGEALNETAGLKNG